MLRVGLCGGVAVEADGRRLPETLLAGRQGRLVFAYLICERHRSVPREELAELVWGERLPSSWASSLSAVVSKLRRLLAEAGLDGPTALASAFGSYRLHLPDDTWVDWQAVADAVERAERAMQAGQAEAAISAALDAHDIARRGFLNDDCLWVDTQRERLRDLHVRATQVQAQAHLAAGERGRAVVAAREALGLDELRETSYRLLMQTLAEAGERGEALRVWERCRTMLVEELGTDPAPETEAVYLSILGDAKVAVAPAAPAPLTAGLPSGVVTFLLTDIVDSSALWERDPAAMSVALQRHDQLVAEIVASNGGVLLKAKLEGDATVSVFPRASAGALAALALGQALKSEPWPEEAAPEVRMALHTGEAVERDGDYFGPALNRAARLRSLAGGGQILVSQAVAEVVRDHLPDAVTLRSLGERQLRGMTRGEHVYELAPTTAGQQSVSATPLDRPPLPPALTPRGPFVGRESELERLATEWASALAGTARALFIAGEPGVGKTRLAAESARQAYDQGAIVLYGRCDEELGAPYQPFAEALRVLVNQLGASRLRSVRGVEQLSRLVPELEDVIPGLGAPSQADPDTERSLLFDATARLFASVSAEVPVLIVVDDLHWAAKPTLLLLRHLLRSGDGVRLCIVGTYRTTDLERTHPLAGVLVDLQREAVADRITLSGLDPNDVSAYLSAAGYRDTQLGVALSNVTSGNPFFLIEVLRHVEESGGRWDETTLPQGVREAVGRRLTRLSPEANEALLVGAVTGSEFSLELVERVIGRDLVDTIDEARRAALIVEESGGRFRFNHALVRQSLLAEVASVKRIRLHQRIATALEADPSSPQDARVAELARHYFECAFAGGAAKAVDYSRRAGEQAMTRLAYEEAADLYDRALQAMDIDGSGGTDEDKAELLIARCEALLAAGEPTAAGGVVDELVRTARSAPKLAAWATCFAGQLAVLTHPERLDATAHEVAAAAEQFAAGGDAEGEAKAYTVRASCLARLGRVADCEAALDRALTAGRRAGNPRRVNAVLAFAPLAALWGPSPVARASGRCLDVVRVLRITTGSPAVEAVALRSQAVLEALRGRADAARRMLGSAHRSLESLGHTHGLLETEVFAGLVELYAGEPGEAEVALRKAYDGFVARGVGVDAAQAAALLARAVLAQGRVDEALALTEDSERLAGVDLKAAIAWRSARGEALVQQGDTAAALDAARVAVALADPTDALIDQADAHLSLSIVLRAAGKPGEAEREGRRAIELYERKGATARVEAVQALFGSPSSVPTRAADDPTRRRVRPNLATEAALSGPMTDDRVRGWRTQMADDLVFVDHLVQLTLDRDGLMETFRRMAIGGQATTTQSHIASLGQRHCLTRFVWRSETPSPSMTAGPAEVVDMNIWQTDAKGRIRRVERFKGDDLNRAVARLIQLHAEDELLSEQRARQSGVAGQFRDRRMAWTDDAVVVDHRPASLGTLAGREAIRSAGAALHDLVAELTWKLVDVLALTESGCVMDILTEGQAESGGPVEMALLTVNDFDGEGRLRRSEWYSRDQVEDALNRFDELNVGARSEPRRRVRTNLAANARQRAADLVGVGDLEAFAAQIADEFVLIDDSTKIITGREAYLHEAQMMAAAERVSIGVEPLASLGERHALSRVSYQAEGAAITQSANRTGIAEIDTLNVTCVDTAGSITRVERYAVDDLNLALARLVELHADSELSAERCDARYAVAAQLREPSRRWSSDAVIVDHRPASLGTLEGREAIRAAAQALRDVAGDVGRRVTDILGLTERVGLLDSVFAGRTDSGEPFELPMLTLGEYGEDGSLRRVEWFLPEQIAEALDRFDELTATPDPGPRRVRPNAATTAAGLQSPQATVLASLGQRHALTRLPGNSGSEILEVIRADEGAGLVVLSRFAGGDLNLALARLVEAHSDELPEDQQAAQYRRAEMFRRIHTQWSDDAVLVDRRSASLGTLRGRDAIAGAAAALRGLEIDLRRRFADVIGLTEAVSLFEMLNEGTVDGGGPVELSVFAVSESDANGLCCRQEWYGPDQRNEALARFDELVALQAADKLSNAAYRALARRAQAFNSGDWHGVAAALAEDAVLDDRRALVGVNATGREACVRNLRSAADIGVIRIEHELVAARGDCLALVTGSYQGRDGYSDLLGVVESDAAGLVCRLIALDRDDLDGAFAELDARYLAGEGAAHAHSLTPMFGFLAAYNRQDWNAARTLLADDLVVVDHRPAPYGHVNGPDELITALRTGFDVSVDRVLRALAVHDLNDRGAVLQARTTALTRDGGQLEVALLLTYTVAGSRIKRLEVYEDDADAAIARLASLTTVPSWLENAATRRSSALRVAFIDRAWERFGAQLAPGVVVEDRRPLVGGMQFRGRSEVVALYRGVADVGATEVTATVIATRANLLALELSVYRGADGESDILRLLEVDDDGLVQTAIGFDAADLDAAYEELDARYAAGEAADFADEWSTWRAFRDAYQARDWKRLEALHADDLVLLDHRPAGWGTLDRDTFLGTMRGLVELSPTVELRFVAVPRLARGCLLTLARLSGRDAADGDFEIEMLAFGNVVERRVRRIELFSDADLPAALARLDELLATSDEPARLSDYLWNDAARRMVRLVQCFIAHDWSALAAEVADDAVTDDRRALVGRIRYEGRQGVIAAWQGFAAIGVTEIDMMPLATRGERLVLQRELFRGSDGEGEGLTVREFTTDGLYLGGIAFDPDDLDNAFAELDARYAAGEGAPFDTVRNALAGYLAAYNTRDWDAVERLHADDVVFVDHRPAAFGRQEHDEYLRTRRELVDLLPDAVMRVLAVGRMTPVGGAFVIHVVGHDALGGEVEYTISAVAVVDPRNGRIRALELYAADDLSVAADRLGELSASTETSTEPVLECAGTEQVARFLALLASHDWPALEAVIADDAVLDDRRAIVGLRAEGRDAVVRYMRSIGEMGVTFIDRDVLATRGERVVLQRELFRGSDGETESLFVWESAPDGLFQYGCSFDPDNLDAAFDELDARYAAGEAAPYASIWAAATAAASAVNRHDWSELRSYFADSTTMVDHRPLGLPELDADGIVELLRAMFAVSPDSRLRMAEVLGLTSNGIAYRQQFVGTSETGGAYEISGLFVGRLRAGKWDRIEVFAADEAAAALECLEGFGGPSSSRLLLTNAASRQWGELSSLFATRDWNAFAAQVSPEAVADDRRAVVGGLRFEGRDGVITAWRSAAEIGGSRLSDTTMATRGERLVLVHSVVAGVLGEVEALFVHEFSEGGLYLGGVCFDLDDTDAAFDELDARYAAGEALPFAEEWAAVNAGIGAYNRRDWNVLTAAGTDDFVFVDHSPAGLGSLAGPEYLVSLEAIVDLAPDIRFRIAAVHGLCAHGFVYGMTMSGSSSSGGEFEIPGVGFVLMRDGRSCRMERFPTHQLAEAIARFEELTTESLESADAVKSRPAFEQAHRLNDAIIDHDWATVANLFATDIVREDRRRGLQSEYVGREEAVAENQLIAGPVRQLSGTVVATRGDRIVLLATHAHGEEPTGSGVDYDLLWLGQLDPDHRFSYVVWFDPDDLTEALAELDRCFVAQLAPEHAAAWRVTQALVDRYNRRDANGLRMMIAEDAVVVDERVTGWGTIDPDTFVANLQQLITMAPDAALACTAVHGVEAYGSATRFRVSGTVPGGGAFEMLFETVGVSQNGKVARLDLLPEGQVDEALRRLREAAP